MLTWSIAMTLEEIRELIRLVSETGVAELEVQRGENRVRIRQRTGSETNVLLPVTPALQAADSAPRPENPPAAAASAPQGAVPKENGNTTYVKSPIVGTFYESATPGTPPFVRVGEHVKPGKVLCIIESMKLMNEIEADIAGIIESKLVENGQPVEYGEALFGIRPV
jgi:acetyl-CoA carboxylase biotin carboxyl carrier protein